MFKFLRKKKAQSTVEYAVLIVIVIGALLSIQVYVKRGIQGRMQSASDDIGEQFSPGNTNYYKRTTVYSHTNEITTATGSVSNLIEDEWTNVDRTSNIVNVQQEFWG